MSVLKNEHSNRQAGKGDAPRHSLSKFQKNFPKTDPSREFSGRVFLKKNNRTHIIYK